MRREASGPLGPPARFAAEWAQCGGALHGRQAAARTRWRGPATWLADVAVSTDICSPAWQCQAVRILLPFRAQTMRVCFLHDLALHLGRIGLRHGPQHVSSLHQMEFSFFTLKNGVFLFFLKKT